MKPIPPDKEALMNELLDEHLDGMLRLAYRRDAEQKTQEILEDSQRPFTPDEDAQIELAYQQFLTKYAAHLRAQRKAGRRTRLRKAIRRTIRVISCLILALAVVLPIALPYAVAKNDRVRSAVLEMITVRHDDGSASLYVFEDKDSEFDVPADWKGEYYPAYIPDGFRLVELGPEAYVSYLHENGSVLILREYSSYASVGVDTEEATISYETINGAQAMVVTTPNAARAADGSSLTKYKLIWTIDDKYFLMITTVSKEEALQIARSVRKIVTPDPYAKPLEEQTDIYTLP